MHENKRDHEILYTLTIPRASSKDSGIYSCSITDIMSNDSQTKQLMIHVYGAKVKIYDTLDPRLTQINFLLSNLQFLSFFFYTFHRKRLPVHIASVCPVRVG